MSNGCDNPGVEDVRVRVAVIGAGVAGLGAAWHLASLPNVDLSVFESEGRAGGHANTLNIEVDGKTVPVDTGFMVFNEENYPNMVQLFDRLGVGKEETDMSFSVSLDNGAMEWGSSGLASLFAKTTNAFSPSFHCMLRDMARFNREAPLLLELDDDDPRKAVSVREYLKVNNYGEAFARHYLVPMAAALWSSSSADVMNFSALTMISFFHNHQMLQVFGRPQWMTPAGRSTMYVQAICAQIGNSLELGNACTKVSRRAASASTPAAAAVTPPSLSGRTTQPSTDEVIESGVDAEAVAGEAEAYGGAVGSVGASGDIVEAGVGMEGQGEGVAEGGWEVTDSKGVVRVYDHVSLKALAWICQKMFY
ncbi:unnamed protein product [Choristocarpus tenellus]